MQRFVDHFCSDCALGQFRVRKWAFFSLECRPKNAVFIHLGCGEKLLDSRNLLTSHCCFQVQTKSFDDDFDTDPEDEVVPQPSGAAKASTAAKDDDEEDSDFEDPDLIEVPGGGKSLQTLASTKIPNIGGSSIT